MREKGSELARSEQVFNDRAVARLLLPESALPEVVSRGLGVSVNGAGDWRAHTLGLTFENIPPV